MDITLARTFIEIVAAGNFAGAAKRLNVTQSAVSMRVRSLESLLGRRLFNRNKAGAVLTPAGEQFHRYAITLTQVWEQACHHVAVPKGFRAVLAVGAQFSLWDGLLMRWLPWMRMRAPEVSLNAEYGQPDRLMLRLVEGVLDIGVMYTPQSRPGLKVDLLLEDNLVLVSTNPSSRGTGDPNYVYMDWGPEFRRDHSLSFTDFSSPGMLLSLGSLGLQYVLENGGSGYFPKRVVNEHLDSGRLTLVKDAPVFTHPAYVVYAADRNAELIQLALQGLREVIRANA